MSTDFLTVDQLKYQLALRRITLTTSNGRLIADDPTERLTPILDRAIRQHREALLSGGGTEFPEMLHAVKRAVFAKDLEDLVAKAEAAYAARQMTAEELESLAVLAAGHARQIPYSLEDMPLSQFSESGLVREVQSRVLGEVILFAADNAEVATEPTEVVYRTSELRHLVGMPCERLRAVHAAKKAVDGELVSPLEEEDAIVIPIEALLEPLNSEGACFACGQDLWWTCDGRRICGMCHLPPSMVR